MNKILVQLTVLGALCLSCESTTSTTNIAVTSFNIRYDNPQDGINQWDNRKELVLKTIQEKSPTLLGLQEALYHQYTFLSDKIKGYTSYFVGRDDGETEGEGVPIFVNQKWSVLHKGTFWLSHTPEVVASKGEGAVLPRICTYTKLKSQQGKTIYFFNTHYSHMSEKARLFSSQLLMQEINKIAKGAPTIITGDFNASISSSPIQEIIGKKNGHYQFSMAYDIATPSEKGKTTFNNWKENHPQAKIDYIFFSQHFTANNYRVLNIKEGEKFISDHYPVAVDLTIK